MEFLASVPCLRWGLVGSLLEVGTLQVGSSHNTAIKTTINPECLIGAVWKAERRLPTCKLPTCSRVVPIYARSNTRTKTSVDTLCNESRVVVCPSGTLNDEDSNSKP